MAARKKPIALPEVTTLYKGGELAVGDKWYEHHGSRDWGASIGVVLRCIVTNISKAYATVAYCSRRPGSEVVDTRRFRLGYTPRNTLTEQQVREHDTCVARIRTLRGIRNMAEEACSKHIKGELCCSLDELRRVADALRDACPSCATSAATENGEATAATGSVKLTS